MSVAIIPRTDEIKGICERALAGKRVSYEEGVALLSDGGIHQLGRTAHQLRLINTDPSVVTYIIDRNINYSNVCVTDCDFCAFYRRPGEKDAYVNEYEPVLKAKIQEAVELGARQILMQGGHHPYLKFEWYLELVRSIKRDFPQVSVHSFSPPEIRHFSKLYKMSVEEVLSALKEAGLDSLPGGGAEILSERPRKEISPKKGSPDEWIEIMRTAHNLGLRGTATMMFGHVETLPERVEHFERIRQLQDETNGFTAFICWSFQPWNTPLGAQLGYRKAGGSDYLRTLSTARIYIDNIKNFQASWVTMGAKVGQLSLFFGANDMGGTMIEENVVSAAGAHYCMSIDEMEQLIRDAGFTPRRRTTQYELV